ncbi:transmembrane protein 132A [Antechinus flavipes]|uniref:transmembrane protein 132A n=1 Tax=Antechinus flavipes TaxID=38775 RepID=UPI0022360EB7|nr:transmembrane protein 132A [Antechinus flavipes]
MGAGSPRSAPPRGPGRPGRPGLGCLWVALLVLKTVRGSGDAEPPDPVYLPATLELLGVPEYFRLQQIGRYPPANSSLGSRSESFLLLHPWPGVQPLVRASYPPFGTQQAMPAWATEPRTLLATWDVRAVSVETVLTPVEPHARVLFYLKGQDWQPSLRNLPCARLHAIHPLGTIHRACRFQPSLGACVVEMEFPRRWFSSTATTKAELAYTLELGAEEPGQCAPAGEGTPPARLLPVGWVEIQQAEPPRQQEVPLDAAVRLRVSDAAVRAGQPFNATILLRNNFTDGSLTLWIKVKKGLQVTAARPAHPSLWTAKLEKLKGSKHPTLLVTCQRTGPGLDTSLPGFSEFLWVDFVVENGTGATSSTRPVTWQLEYPSQVPEAKKEKMVWEILVSERDVRALVPMAKTEELVNTSPLTGIAQRVPIRLVTVAMGGAVAEVTEQVGCESANTQVLQVSEACSEVFVEGKESQGNRGVQVDFWWRRLRASLRVTVWAPLLPLRIEMTDTTLEQVRGWRVPGTASGAPTEPEEGGEEADRRARGCRLQYQRAGVRFLVPFVAHPQDGGRHLIYLLGPDWLLDVTHLVGPHARVQDPRVATLEAGSVLVGREPGVTSLEVRSPVSDSILGEQTLSVTDEKVSVLELRVQPVMSISLALNRGTAHPGEITATCWAHTAPPGSKQAVAFSLWLAFSDHTLAPAELFDRRDLALSVSTEEPGAFSPAVASRDTGDFFGGLVSGAAEEGTPLQVGLHSPEACRRGKHRPPLASATAWLGPPPAPPQQHEQVPPVASAPPVTQSQGGGGRRQGPEDEGGLRSKFERPEHLGEEPEEEEEEEPEEEEEEMVRAPQRVTDLELGLYALLSIFCLAILIFLINGVVFVLRYQRKEPPDAPASGGPTSPQPHNWVWLGTDQEELSRQLDRRPPREERPPSPAAPASGEGGCHCEGGGGGGGSPDPTPPLGATLPRKEPGGRRKRVEFVTFAAAPPARPPEEPPAPAVQSILVAGEDDIRWVCEDMGLRDPDELRSYMERIRGSS